LSRDPRAELPEPSSRRRHRRGLSIGRIFGIQIEIDPSWIFIFLLVTWSLAAGFFQIHSDWPAAVTVATAIAAALLFFGSVLVHELSHSLVARSRGLQVKRITLFLFGGVSNIEREPASPGTEFVMALVGPLSSLVLGFVFWMLGVALVGSDMLTAARPLESLRGAGPLPTLLLWLGPINVILGVFNLVPGFPLDGGRILRSILWGATGDLKRATYWASRTGQVIAWLLILAGISMAFGMQIPFFGTGFVGGLWLAFIGWFLNNAAAASYRQVEIEDLLGDVPVSRLMRRDVPTVAPATPLSDLVYDRMLGTDQRAFPVVGDGRLEGLVCLEDVRRIPRAQWDATPVRSVMTPISNLAVVRPDLDAAEAFRTLSQKEVGQLPVLEDGRLVGLLRLPDIVRWIHLQSA
jgi:Zn-dependent protease/CBS domain-containing protein